MDVLLTILISVVVVSLVIQLWIRWTLKTPEAPRRLGDHHHGCRCSATPLPIAGVGDVDGFGDEYRNDGGPDAA